MRPFKTKALRKREPPREAGRSGISQVADELYFIHGGSETELDDNVAWSARAIQSSCLREPEHTIKATKPLRGLCSCEPPYTHEATHSA